MNDNSDSVGFVVLLVAFAVLVAFTCAAVGWRLTGHDAPFGTTPVTPATAPGVEAVPFQEDP